MLSRAFSAVQRLASGNESHGEDDVELPEGNSGLVQVIRGSAIYAIANPNPERAIEHLRLTGKVLKKPEAIGDQEFILGALDELSAVSRSQGTPIILKEPGREGVVLARILPGSFAHVSDSLLINGESTVFGRVERVGGATERKCALRVTNRTRLLFCSVETNETARQLGQKLYEEVAAKGTASWIKTTWRISKFSIRTITQPKLKPFNEMIDALRDAGGSDWDKISDPQSFLDEVAK